MNQGIIKEKNTITLMALFVYVLKQINYKFSEYFTNIRLMLVITCIHQGPDKK